MPPKRHAFRLERLLELKAKHEEAMAIRLGAAERDARAERESQAALEQLQATGRSGLLGPSGLRRVGDLRPLAELLDRVGDRLDVQVQRVRAADRSVHEAQQRLVVAHQERRVLDRLREKHDDRVRLESAQADQKTMDDIAVARFLRSKPLDP
jgi:flagellar protein FliJ